MDLQDLKRVATTGFAAASILTVSPATAQQVRVDRVAGDLLEQGLGALVGALSKPKTPTVAAPTFNPNAANEDMASRPWAEITALKAQCEAPGLSKDFKKQCRDLGPLFKHVDAVNKAGGFVVKPSAISGQFTYGRPDQADPSLDIGAITGTVPGKKGKKPETFAMLPFKPGARTLGIVTNEGGSQVDIAALQGVVKTGSITSISLERITDAKGKMVGEGDLIRMIPFQGTQAGEPIITNEAALRATLQPNTGINAWLASTDPSGPTTAPSVAPPASGNKGPVIPKLGGQ